MKRQMPSRDNCARFALTVVTFVLSQFRLTPSGRTASATCVAAAKWGATARIIAKQKRAVFGSVIGPTISYVLLLGQDAL
jgi:uncharacterized hydantoinase/oxoprolinase family protein